MQSLCSFGILFLDSPTLQLVKKDYTHLNSDRYFQIVLQKECTGSQPRQQSMAVPYPTPFWRCILTPVLIWTFPWMLINYLHFSLYLLVMERDLTWGGEHTIQCTDDVLQKCTPEP